MIQTVDTVCPVIGGKKQRYCDMVWRLGSKCRMNSRRAAVGRGSLGDDQLFMWRWARPRCTLWRPSRWRWHKRPSSGPDPGCTCWPCAWFAKKARGRKWKKKNSNKMCLAFLIVHMSIDYTNTHLYLLPWQTSPWCKPNQSERYLSQKHPAFKDETKVFSKRFSIKIHRQQLKYY